MVRTKIALWISDSRVGVNFSTTIGTIVYFIKHIFYFSNVLIVVLISYFYEIFKNSIFYFIGCIPTSGM